MYPELSARIAAQWPELSLYETESGEAVGEQVPAEIGYALDDLGDVANDFAQALRLAEEDAVGARDLLRFTMQTHWGEHVQDLVRHLDTLIAH